VPGRVVTLPYWELQHKTCPPGWYRVAAVHVGCIGYWMAVDGAVDGAADGAVGGTAEQESHESGSAVGQHCSAELPGLVSLHS
jgi:hypothetical protein